MTEAFDVFSEIGVHVLKHQIQYRIPFFIFTLLEIQQPTVKWQQNKPQLQPLKESLHHRMIYFQ